METSTALKPSELKDILPKFFKNKMPVLVKGAPGVGKSDIISEAAKESGYELIFSHPVVEDPTNYKGMPWVVDGEADFLPFQNLKAIIEADKPTVFFIDDMGQGTFEVQKAIMQLLLARCIGDHEVSDHVVFVAATNGKKDRAGVSGVLEPVKSRFASILELSVNVDDWSEWARNFGITPVLVSFVNYRPNLLHDFEPTAEIVNTPSPRTIKHVDDILKMELPSNLEYKAIIGAAGQGFATEFQAFLDIYRNLEDPKEVLKNPETCNIPEDSAEKWAFCTALVEHVEEDTMDNLLTITKRIAGREYSMLVFYNINSYRRELMHTAAFTQWATENHDLF